MESFATLFSTFPPRIFWNLLVLSAFHLLALFFLRFRLKALAASEDLISKHESSQEPLTALAVVLLHQLTAQEIAHVRALLSQIEIQYRLLLLLPKEHQVDQKRLQLLLDDYPQIQTWVYSLEEVLASGYTQGFASEQPESRALAASVLLLQQPNAGGAESESGFANQSTPDVVAVVNPQLLPHSRWLNELVAPLADKQVAAATVYPWLNPFPKRGGLGGLLQYAWNGFSILQMLLLSKKSTWAGAIAVKSSFIMAPRRLRLWQVMGGTDIALGRLVTRKHYRSIPVLSLMENRRQPLPFSQFFPEVRSRLGAMRRHLTLWIFIGGQGVFASLTAFRAYRRFLSRLLNSELAPSVWLCLGIALYWTVIFLMLVMIENQVRRSRQQRSRLFSSRQSQWPVSWVVLGPALFGIAPVAQLAHCLTAVLVVFRKRYVPQRRRFPFLRRWLRGQKSEKRSERPYLLRSARH